MAAYNSVIAGDYEGTIQLLKRGAIGIVEEVGLFRRKQITYINKETVESYEVVMQDSEKSAKSGIVKGLVGGALLGGIGAVAGATSGKVKTTRLVSLIFKDGTKALCELDDMFYKELLKALY